MSANTRWPVAPTRRVCARRRRADQVDAEEQGDGVQQQTQAVVVERCRDRWRG